MEAIYPICFIITVHTIELAESIEQGTPFLLKLLSSLPVVADIYRPLHLVLPLLECVNETYATEPPAMHKHNHNSIGTTNIINSYATRHALT